MENEIQNQIANAACKIMYVNKEGRGRCQPKRSRVDKLYNISQISSLLDSKRLSLLNELVVNANTRQYVLHVLILSEKDRSFSFITEINNTCIDYNIDIPDYIVNRKSIDK